MNLEEKIASVEPSIVAIGFTPTKETVTVTGSGFAVLRDGKILSAAHIYNQTPPDQKENLKALVMTETDSTGLIGYNWLPLKLLKKDDKNDAALFQLKNYSNTLLKPLELGDSEKVTVGTDTYFIGFPYAAQLMNDGFGVTLIANRAMVSNVKRDGIDPQHPKNWFIVDAISNPGNSGCPLIDVETNEVIGIMTIAFRMQSQINKEFDIREPMHIAGAKPINVAKNLLA